MGASFMSAFLCVFVVATFMGASLWRNLCGQHLCGRAERKDGVIRELKVRKVDYGKTDNC